MGYIRGRTIGIDVRIVTETERAWLIYSEQTGKEAWVPKSMARLEDDKTLVIDEVYATGKGLT